ncbi:MAG: hypothetical protein H0T94_04070 [Acidimicrobiia bacterium]|nr:hypothetical protein [Acidimicrobiia bacterium]
MEWLGTFEVPGTGRRVGGRLVIGDRKSELTTFDALSLDRDRGALPTDSAIAIPMVWGRTEDGKRITVVNLRSLAWRLFEGAWGTERWLCDFAIDNHLVPEEPLRFSSLSVGLTDLSSWLESPVPRPQWTIDEVHVEEVQSLRRVEHGDLAYEFQRSWGTRSGFDEVTIEYPTFATVTSTAELELEELVNLAVTPLEALLWVSTGRFSELDISQVRLEGERPVYEKLWASFLKPLTHETPARRLHKSDMLFTANELPGGLDGGLRRWLDRWEDIQQAFGPVIARYRAPFTYADDRFATSVSALESYSTRVKHGKFEIPKRERKERIARVEAALQSEAPDLIDWVRSALRYAGQYELKTRLALLLDEAGNVSEALFGEQGESFIQAVVKSRNQVAHSLVRRGGIEGGGNLHWTFRGLNWLLRYHAMLELGFSEQEAQTRIIKNCDFQQEAERLKRDLGMTIPPAPEASDR